MNSKTLGLATLRDVDFGFASNAASPFDGDFAAEFLLVFEVRSAAAFLADLVSSVVASS